MAVLNQMNQNQTFNQVILENTKLILAVAKLNEELRLARLKIAILEQPQGVRANYTYQRVRT